MEREESEATHIRFPALVQLHRFWHNACLYPQNFFHMFQTAMNGQHNIAPLIRKQSSLAQVFLIREDSKQCCHLRIDEERRKNSTHSDSTVGNRFRSNFRCIIKLNAEKTAEQKSHLVIRTPSRGGLRGKSCSRAL